MWEKMLSGTKKLLTDNDIIRQVKRYGIKTPADFFSALATQEISGEEVIERVTNAKKEVADSPAVTLKDDVRSVDGYLRNARHEQEHQVAKKDEVIIAGMNNIAYSFAKCCQPVPGDEVIGFVTMEGMVKIHRKNCINVSNENLLKNERAVSVTWNKKVETDFLAGIRIVGEDRIGITNQITTVISKSETNIRGISLDAKDGMFTGTFMVYVRNIEKLTSLMDRLKKVQGIFTVERLLS